MHPKQKAWSELSTESTGYFGKIWGSNPLMISPSLSDLLFNILNIQCCSNPLIYPSKWSCYIAATALDYSYYHWETPSIFLLVTQILFKENSRGYMQISPRFYNLILKKERSTRKTYNEGCLEHLSCQI